MLQFNIEKQNQCLYSVYAVGMADHGDDDHDAPEETPGYKPPAPKSMEEILKSDADDESLRKYKESLLGAGSAVGLEICEWFCQFHCIINSLLLGWMLVIIQNCYFQLHCFCWNIFSMRLFSENSINIVFVTFPVARNCLHLFPRFIHI